MPAADADLRDDSPPPEHSATTQLPFPPLTRQHVLNCSVHNWHPKYRSLTPKTRLIPLPQPFIDYLGRDGIILPSEENVTEDTDSADNPLMGWIDTHKAIKATIQELGGKVHPKLNWSAPKDAVWIAATNTMECSVPEDIYLLLKSSDFITHDLDQAFHGCEPGHEVSIPYHLVLRKSIPSVVTSMEFRCFVKKRQLIGICQRDQNHYDFLESLVPVLTDLIENFFNEKLRDTFPDENFVFDVYVPQPKEKGRVWLIDINPWAPRTDPMVFSWLELLTLDVPDITTSQGNVEDGVARLSLQDNNTSHEAADDVEELTYAPEFRIIEKDDPEAYRFNSPLYSAHKMPQEVVHAGNSGTGGMRDFIERVKEQEDEAVNHASDDER